MSTTIATSLKLPVELKAAIDEDARRQGLSSHAYMVRTLAEAAGRARLREQFTQDALAAEREMLATGMGYDWQEVKDYLKARAHDRQTPRPPPRPLR